MWSKLFIKLYRANIIACIAFLKIIVLANVLHNRNERMIHFLRLNISSVDLKFDHDLVVWCAWCSTYGFLFRAMNDFCIMQRLIDDIVDKHYTLRLWKRAKEKEWENSWKMMHCCDPKRKFLPASKGIRGYRNLFFEKWWQNKNWFLSHVYISL